MFGKSPKQELNLKIDGMTCEHCAARVRKSLQSIAGVHNVKVDLKGKGAVVSADPEVKVDALVAAVTDAGYTCSAAS